MSDLPKISFLTVKDVAGFLRVSKKWVYLHQTEIPGYIKIHGIILFNEEVFIKELAKKSGQRLN